MTTISPDEESRAQITMVQLKPKVSNGSEFVVPREHLKISFLDYGIDTGGTLGFDGQERLEFVNASGVFCAELPFSHPDARISEFRFNVDAEPAQGQEIILEAYSKDRNRWEEIPSDQSIRNAGYALPITGRLYFRLLSREKEEGGASWVSESKIQDLDLIYRGRVE